MYALARSLAFVSKHPKRKSYKDIESIANVLIHE